MGTITFPDDGLQPHLAWPRDELGGAPTWLVETTSRIWAACPNGYHTLVRDVRDQIETLGRRVLDEQLTVAHGPLHGQPTSRGPR